MSKDNTITSKPSAPSIDDRVGKKNLTTLPTGRQSQPNIGANYNPNVTALYSTVTPEFVRETIPLIRLLMKRNPDVGQAIHNIVSLGNTGHKIFFDRKRSAAEVDAMRNHLKNKRSDWATGTASIDGLINKFIAQVLVGGAISAEWVPNNTLTGIESCVLVNPEEIEFVLDPVRATKYIPYQRVNQFAGLKKNTKYGLVTLNTNTYRYFGLNGDTELPYGFPPYLTAIDAIDMQLRMVKNIKFVVDQMGLLGFLEALINKPDQLDGEDDVAYMTRLTNILVQAKTRMLEGFKDGVVAGFKDDHEFNFNTAARSYEKASGLYDNNELNVASGLKQDASLWGRSYSTSETQITVVFIKMLSELKNIQTLVGKMLEFGYALELRLAGFNFDSLEVKFNKSTIQDELKYQQAQEIKIRNVQSKMILGLLNQDQAADELDYEQSAYPEPQVSWDVLAGQADPAAPPTGTPATGAKKKADTKKKKTASAKKKRNDNKVIPK